MLLSLPPIVFKELPNEKEYVVIKPHGKIHTNSIRRIVYSSKNNSIFTCSRDPDTSVVQSCALGKKKLYVFKMRRVSIHSSSLIFVSLSHLVIELQRTRTFCLVSGDKLFHCEQQIKTVNNRKRRRLHKAVELCGRFQASGRSSGTQK